MYSFLAFKIVYAAIFMAVYYMVLSYSLGVIQIEASASNGIDTSCISHDHNSLSFISNLKAYFRVIMFM